MNMRTLIWAASFCALWAFAPHVVAAGAAESTSAAGASVPREGAVSGAIAPQVSMTAQQVAMFQTENDKIRSDLIAASNRLSTLDGAMSKAGDRAEATAARSALFAFLTVLVSVFAGVGGQYILIRIQRRLTREQERAKVSNSYIEWQLKQLSELYGPLRALLGQSIAIYRQMNMVLITADDKRFRLEQKPGADFDDAEFQILVGGKWERFRTVEHLPLVYGKGNGVDPYFDDVVKAGARIADMIRTSAGYARHEDKILIQVMGTYLAHYGVLCRLHERAVNGDDVKPTAADIKASFPFVIHELVDVGFNAINAQVMDWKNFRPAQIS